MNGLIRASLRNPIAVTVHVAGRWWCWAAWRPTRSRSTSCRCSRARRCRRWSSTAGCPRRASRRTSPRGWSAGWSRRRAAGGSSRGRSSASSIVRDYFRSNVDRSGALTEVNSLAGWEYPTMPPGTLPPVVLPYDPTSATPVCLVALDSPSQGEATLFDVGPVRGPAADHVAAGGDRPAGLRRQGPRGDGLPRPDEAPGPPPLAAGRAEGGRRVQRLPAHRQRQVRRRPTTPSTRNSMFDVVGSMAEIPLRNEHGNAAYLARRGDAEGRQLTSRPTSCASTASARSTSPSSASSAPARSRWSTRSRGRSRR